MAMPRFLLLILAILGLLHSSRADAPISFFDWVVSYETRAPLGVKQQVIVINGMFPGPVLNTTTNRINIVNVQNNLDEPFLLTWDGIQNRRNAWMDGVAATNCPIPAGQNFTYNITAKDQIGSFFYWPTTMFQRAAGGVGSVRVNPRAASGVRVPFAPPDGDIVVMIGDWYTRSHKELRASLDRGVLLGMPDGVLINGKGAYNRTTDYETIPVRRDHVYRFRVTNVGVSTTLNFRIQGHQLNLVETEGSYTVQQPYDSIDIFVGQSYSFLLNCTANASDYYIVASPRFVGNETEWANITGVGVLHYLDSKALVNGPLPEGPSIYDGGWSVNQARQLRRNLTTGAARPNPQGSFHYGQINVTQTFVLTSTAVSIAGKRRFAVNGFSFEVPSTPLLLADEYNITGLYKLNSFPEKVGSVVPGLQTSVVNATYAGFLEIIFQNPDNNSVQSWHVDGYAAFVVGYGPGQWTENDRGQYNKWDAVSRSTVQVFPGSWTAIQISLDNVGLWNIRSEDLVRHYLGQEIYMFVNDPSDNIKNTAFPKPDNVLYCGRLANLAPLSSRHRKSSGTQAAKLSLTTLLTLASAALLSLLWL
ncbi:hypothetical protein SELMODRAFT_445960 [Selaginella moellendorffii]|uniref:Monocopper oxidase-like protein SKU5 n=1 Tax=Selaginella moellendorffii TaxID=88036 RepID=D8SMQ7_SELML|nr:monocopper oxidase-like protein SKU5 [Selaginella moellendorffii]EFJ14224.1 hypothetical protein SELMODRAFT_445960 [Selaginella moellendorffii]|eukprot:XP_002984579.1 monocopper oxidase-like protein SKU5 [Selaginella moellendorffii]